MVNRKELTEIKEWVVIDRKTNTVNYFETFDEALNSPIKGHLMSKYYYQTTYLNKD